MIVSYLPEYYGGYWKAQGMGPARYIVVEAASRKSACKGWIELASSQLSELCESEFKPYTAECYTEVADDSYYPLPTCEH